MALRAVFFRLLGVLCVIAVVFFASFFIAIAMRSTSGRSAAGAAVTTSTNTSTQAPESTTITPALTSPPAKPVATTVPGSATSTTTSTTTTTIDLDPDIARLEIDPVFDPIHDRLATEVLVPIRLPAELGVDTSSWQPTIGSIAENGYVIHIGNGNECNGASACRISTFTARQSSEASPQLGSGTQVPLPNGLTGVFTDSSCGQDCNNGFITWIEAGVRYSVGSRVASGQAVLDLAWRSIDRSLPTPTGPDICGPGAPQHEGRVARTITSELDDDRVMHWIAVCSEDGTDVEMLDAPGDLRWVDIDRDGFHDALVRHDDGTTTVFALDGNRPRAVIDTSGGRLTAGELRCADIDGDGKREAYDVAAGEELRFVSPVAVQRIERDLSEATFVDC